MTMTVDTELEVSTDEQEAPPEDQTTTEPGGEDSEAGESAPQPAEPTARERDLEQRLRRQGTELARARQVAAQAASQVTALQAEVTRIAARQTKSEQDEAVRRERERQNYLNSLPPEKRTGEEVRLLREEVTALKSSGTAVQTAQPAATTTEDPNVEYMRTRAREIMQDTQDEFGVEFSREDIATLNGSNAWDSEEAFTAALARLAAKKIRDTQQAGGNGVTKTNNSQEQPRAGAGAGSPATPRAAGKPGRKPTEDDVKTTVQTYNSAAGPKGNIAKLKEMRAKMG